MTVSQRKVWFILVMADSSTSPKMTPKACFTSASNPASVNLSVSRKSSIPLVISSATSCILATRVKKSTMSKASLLKDAKTFLTEKKYDEVLKTCQEILRLDKKNYHAYCFVGLAHSKLGNTEKSQQAYLAATKLQPDQLVAWQVSAWLLLSSQTRALWNFTRTPPSGNRLWKWLVMFCQSLGEQNPFLPLILLGKNTQNMLSMPDLWPLPTSERVTTTT